MATEDTVEKVARAMLAAQDWPGPFEDCDPRIQECWLNLARAAINAMSDVREALAAAAESLEVVADATCGDEISDFALNAAKEARACLSGGGGE